MKLVITTQVRENYGTASDPYFKCKGGETYVVNNITSKQQEKIEKNGIPVLSSLINRNSNMFEEYIVGFKIVNDDKQVCQPWETVNELFFENNKWVVRRITMNDEYGYFRKEIFSRAEEFTLIGNGETTDVRVVFTMRNGDVVSYKELEGYLNKAA